MTTRTYIPHVAAAMMAMLAGGCLAADDDSSLPPPADDGEALVPAREAARGDSPDQAIPSTLHLGEVQSHRVASGARNVHTIWVAGSPEHPVPLRFSVAGAGGASMRIAVLGPLVGGARPVLGSAGHDAPVTAAEVTVEIDEPAQFLVVVGAVDAGQYQLRASCAGADCGDDVVDALAAPKIGALVGSVTDGGSILIQAHLNRSLATRDKFEIELWRSAPGLRATSELVAVSESSGDQANFVLEPGSVAEGDDLSFVVRSGDGLATADHGTWARFAPNARLFARLDAIRYSDLGAATITGVTGYTEGSDLLSLRRANDGEEIAAQVVEATLPGVVGMGFGSFEATFAPELILAGGELNLLLPRNGDVLSLGRITGDGEYAPLGCFEFCNDLAGEGHCQSAPAVCQ